MATVQPSDKSSSFWLEKRSVLLSSSLASHFSLHTWGWAALRGTGLEFRLPKESSRDSTPSPASLCPELPDSPPNPSYPVSPKSSSQLLWLDCEQHQGKAEAWQRARHARAEGANTTAKKGYEGEGRRKHPRRIRNRVRRWCRCEHSKLQRVWRWEQGAWFWFSTWLKDKGIVEVIGAAMGTCLGGQEWVSPRPPTDIVAMTVWTV